MLNRVHSASDLILNSWIKSEKTQLNINKKYYWSA